MTNIENLLKEAKQGVLIILKILYGSGEIAEAELLEDYFLEKKSFESLSVDD